MKEEEKKLRKLLMELTPVAPGQFVKLNTGHYRADDDNFTRFLRISPIFNRGIATSPNIQVMVKACYIEAACNDAGLAWFDEVKILFLRLGAICHSTRLPIVNFSHSVAFDYYFW